MNLPWSESDSSDDVWLKDTTIFEGKEVVVTHKLDGENCNMYPDRYHARSIDGIHGIGRSWVKKLHGEIKHNIPTGWRVVGENMYAAHSIWYHGLETYFYVFAIFDEHNRCLAWDAVKDIAYLLGLKTAPELYRGIFDAKKIQEAWDGSCPFQTYETPSDHSDDPNPKPTGSEGYVIRVVEEFHHDDFARCVAKMVRKGHVQTGGHWTSMPVLPNKLRGNETRP